MIAANGEFVDENGNPDDVGYFKMKLEEAIKANDNKRITYCKNMLKSLEDSLIIYKLTREGVI